MSDSLIKIENVSKKFCRDLKRSLWYGMQDLGKELLGRRHGGNGELRKDEFWAIRDVSFELKRGECLGLIGPNGAGKSTLLKMLNGLIKPDQGRIAMYGRVGALIELGAGFNPILSGRENIYVNGSVLGFTKEEIDRKIDEIIDFAEIEEFIDMPVQSYSSGMKVRLGFAVAAQMEPDILLIDEILAVGDIGFRCKCYNYVSKINRNAAVIYVSHSMPSVARICSSTSVIESGRKIFYGDTSSGIQMYNSLFFIDDPVMTGSGRAVIHDLFFLNVNDTIVNEIRYQEPLKIRLDATINKEIRHPVFFVGFYDHDMRCVAEINSRNNRVIIENDGNRIKVLVSVESLILNPGDYKVSCCIYCERMQEHCAWHFAAWKIRVTGNFVGMNPIQFPGQWNIL